MQCASCAFFNTDERECHRYAPQPSGEDRKAEWPRVEATDWCGEYKEDPAKTQRQSA